VITQESGQSGSVIIVQQYFAIPNFGTSYHQSPCANTRAADLENCKLQIYKTLVLVRTVDISRYHDRANARYISLAHANKKERSSCSCHGAAALGPRAQLRASLGIGPCNGEDADSAAGGISVSAESAPASISASSSALTP
jgi:hypothetical protein